MLMVFKIKLQDREATREKIRRAENSEVEIMHTGKFYNTYNYIYVYMYTCIVRVALYDLLHI